MYALPEAGPVAHEKMRRALGMTRGVIVQPAPYADDPSAMLSAIAGADGALKGIAVAEPDISPTVLAGWVQAGIAGLRFTEVRAPNGEPYPGSVGFAALRSLAPVMRELGLHAQLWAPPALLAASLPDLLQLRVPLVLDHMAMLNPASERHAALLGGLLPLVGNEDLWLKLVVCRIERADLTGGEAVRELHGRLLDTRPDRMLWGSDWPYVRLEPAPDAAAMLDLFADWTVADDRRQAVLVDNPATLYGF